MSVLAEQAGVELVEWFVIDDRITYCGSQNCADPEFRVKAKYAPWVDAMMRFEGPVAAQNQRLFASAQAIFDAAQVDLGVDVEQEDPAVPLLVEADVDTIDFPGGEKSRITSKPP